MFCNVKNKISAKLVSCIVLKPELSITIVESHSSPRAAKFIFFGSVLLQFNSLFLKGQAQSLHPGHPFARAH